MNYFREPRGENWTVSRKWIRVSIFGKKVLPVSRASKSLSFQSCDTANAKVHGIPLSLTSHAYNAFALPAQLTTLAALLQTLSDVHLLTSLNHQYKDTFHTLSIRIGDSQQPLESDLDNVHELKAMCTLATYLCNKFRFYKMRSQFLRLLGYGEKYLSRSFRI